jgi:predicted esterase
VSNPHRGQPVATSGAPLEESRGVAVMMHGRGRDTDDILGVAERVGEDGIAYLAPAAEGNSWYPLSFVEPIEKNEPRLSYALEVLDDTVNELVESGVPKKSIVLAGFSQGACLVAEYAARNAERWGGIYEGSFDGTPVFLGTSDVDEFVPEERVRESAEVFERMGANITLRVYPGMDHVVNDDEVAVAREILQEVASGKETGD